MAIDFTLSPELEEIRLRVRTFIDEVVRPGEEKIGNREEIDREEYVRILLGMREEAKKAGLWLPHMPKEWGGMGLGHVELAMVQAEAAKTRYGPWVLNCQAPDEGNMHTLLHWGTDEQKERYLRPLCEGRIMSCFAMTEPEVAGSDPTLIRTYAYQDGDEWVINGHKWFVGNASRADFHIVMAVTEPEADPHHRMSMLIVPTSTPGIRMRELGNMHAPDGRHPLWSHCEVFYEDVRVPRENLLGGRGEGFVLAQKRLGPGRIHHAMRWLGVSRRAFDMLCERAVSVSVHGSRLADKQTIQNWVADCAAQMEAARLLTLQAAWRIDRYGASNARLDISMIKYFGAAVMHDVIDKALQVHGSLGFSTDMPLEQMYRWSRAARIYDGPDEVHRVTVAKLLLRRYQPVEVPTEHVPTRREAALRRFQAQLELLTENM